MNRQQLRLMSYKFLSKNLTQKNLSVQLQFLQEDLAHKNSSFSLTISHTKTLYAAAILANPSHTQKLSVVCYSCKTILHTKSSHASAISHILTLHGAVILARTSCIEKFSIPVAILPRTIFHTQKTLHASAAIIGTSPPHKKTLHASAAIPARASHTHELSMQQLLCLQEHLACTKKLSMADYEHAEIEITSHS